MDNAINYYHSRCTPQIGLDKPYYCRGAAVLVKFISECFGTKNIAHTKEGNLALVGPDGKEGFLFDNVQAIGTSCVVTSLCGKKKISITLAAREGDDYRVRYSYIAQPIAL